MVAVAHREADRFIAGSLSHIDVFLVFGSDAGLIAERSNAILRNTGVDPVNFDQITRLEGDEVAVNPGLLFDEARGMGLFAKRRAILIRAGARQFIATIETLIAEPVEDCKILIQSGSLRKDSPLRSLLTRARNTAAIECYPDQARDIERLIDSKVKAAGMEIAPSARGALVRLLGDDRLSTLAEIEKLILYVHGQKRIVESDVINAVADASAFALDGLIYNAFSGNQSFMGNDGSHVYSSTSEAHALISSAIRHAYFLNSLRLEIEAGAAVEQVVERMAGRSVFGAKRDALKMQASHWTRHALYQSIEELNRTTLQSRMESTICADLAMDQLLTIARRFRRMAGSRGPQ